VLLRAIEPLAGADLMRARRGRADDPDLRLGSGPARLCQAMAVDRTLDGHDLTAGVGLWLAAGESGPNLEFSRGRRIGVDYAGEWSDRPWRFWINGHPSVSRT
jgi:DNA-3-methyladenine glycosylase